MKLDVLGRGRIRARFVSHIFFISKSKTGSIGVKFEFFKNSSEAVLFGSVLNHFDSDLHL